MIQHPPQQQTPQTSLDPDLLDNQTYSPARTNEAHTRFQTPPTTPSPAEPIMSNPMTPTFPTTKTHSAPKPYPEHIRPRSLFLDDPTLDTPSVEPPQSPPDISIVNQFKAIFDYSHKYKNRYHQPDRLEAKLSMTNLATNHPWGDDLLLNKDPNTFRLYYQNVNGIQLDEQGGDLHSICTIVQQLSCDLVGLCETKLDVSKYNVRKIISSNFHSHFQSNRFSASTSTIPFEGTYKPGGTMTVCVDHHTSRYQGKFEDPLGRWSTISLTGKNSRVIHFITIYQVVAKATSGPYTSYQQQLTALRLVDRDLTPRQAFIYDIDTYLTNLTTPETQFVIMGDFNEVIGVDQSGFSKISTKFSLVDIHGHFHSITTEVPTYARGTERLDYILCSTPLLTAVSKCGAEPFNQHIHSDHRALFVDWDEVQLFGSLTPTLKSHSQRRLLSKCLPSRLKYIDALHKYCVDHTVFQRLDNLREYPSTPDAESIDRDITRGMLSAENKCRLLGQEQWSLHLQKARLLVDIFKHALSMVRLGLESRHKINKLLAKYGTPIDIPDALGDIKQALKDAQSELRKTRKDSAQHRKDLLATRIAEAQVRNDPTQISTAKRIAKAEDMKALHAKLRFISKDSTNQSGLTKLQIPIDDTQDPKVCTEWKTIDTPDEITKYLLERNKLHFGQAHGTPFTISPLSLQVDFGATTETCQTMLSGDYDASDIDALTNLVVQHFQSVTEDDTLPPSLTEKAMLDKYKFWPESTTTSPSGRHLGHYRSLLPTLPTKTEEEVQRDDRRRELASMHHSMIDYALTNGHAFKRWKKVVNIMLEKDPGNPKIHRLRVIHLYEADYNLILGVKWRELIHHCEDRHLLHPSLYGARPGRGALDPVFLEELTNEITRLSRKPLIKNAEDATACYDRIIPGVGNLASRSHGIHRQVVLVMGRTLEEVRYHLKTHLGVTDEYYQHCTIHPIYGTGQGSANSPTIWLVVSSILFRCYSKHAHGARFESPDRSICIDIFRVGFVDDTCGYVNNFTCDVPSTPEQLIAMLSFDSQLWSDLLWSSGGTLELLKCTYHFSYFKFAIDGTPFLQSGQVGPSVAVQAGGDHSQTVPARSVYNAYKTLGCYKSPSGSQNTQWKVLWKKCNNHARIVSTSPLTRPEGWIYYFSKYLTSVSYPLPVCHFKPEKLQALEKKALPAIFARCGFNRNTSRNILFGPTKYNGGGFRPLSTEQGVGQLQFFVKNWTNDLELGKLLRIAVAWAQINTGVSYPIFDNVNPSLPHFESKWLNSVRQFLRLIQGRLRLAETFLPEIQRVNDTFIMDHILERGSFSPSEIKRINYCRLYLQAVTVSDITNATGSHLSPGVRVGLPTIWSGISRHHKTNQSNPNPTTWRLWSRALTLLANSQDELLVPLRQWIVPPSRQRQSWTVYYDPGGNVLLFSKAGAYERHTHVSRFFNYNPQSRQTSLPEQAYPVSLHEHLEGWRIIRYNSYCPSLKTSPPTTFASYCSLLEYWESQLLETVHFHSSPFEIVSTIEASSFKACSDGSAIAFEGSYGWVLCTEDGTRLAHGAGPVDGHDPRSFRAEGQGMLSVVCLLRRLFEWCCCTTPITGVLATDNTGLIDRVQQQSQQKYPVPNHVFKSDWDVVQAIVLTQTAFAITTTYEHVKGHQDDTEPAETLSLIAQLNVEADKYAGEYRQQFGSYRPLIPLSPTRPVALDIDGKTIHRGFKQAIRDSIHGTHLLEAMQIRYDWPDGTLEMIDWEVHRQSTHSQLGRKTHYIKLCHNILPTGNLVCTYGRGLPDYCPLCKTPSEDFQHILQCQHPSRSKWRRNLLSSLTKKCHDLKTDPILTDILLTGLKNWLQDIPYHTQENVPHDYHQLIHEQNTIGWIHVFQGRITKQWATLQQWHYSGFPKVKGRDGSSWSRKILNHIFTHWNTLWDTRNQDRHGKDSTTRAKAAKEQTIRELEALYTIRHTVLQRDAKLFYEDITDHKAKPTNTIRQWINTYQPLILKSAKDAKNKSLLHVKPINTYFGKG